MNFWRKQLSRSQPELSEGSVGHLGACSVQKTEKEEWKKQQEKEDRDEKTEGEDEGKGPPSGPVNGKERTEVLLQGPEAGDHGCHWAVHRVTTWLQLQIPETEDGKSFEEGVWADEHPSHQAGRLPQWSRVPGPHWWSWRPTKLVLCYMMSSWRLQEAQEAQGRIKGNDVLRLSSHSVMGSVETSLPLTGDSRPPPTFLLLKFLLPLASQAQKYSHTVKTMITVSLLICNVYVLFCISAVTLKP